VHDLDAIRDLVHRYADAVCRRDRDQWAACWADEAVWDLGAGEVSGRQAIVDLWAGAMGAFTSVIQTVHNGTASLDGDHGSGCWYVQEHYRLATGEPGILLARYDDAYRRHAGTWRFARRALVPYYQGPPDLSAGFRSQG